MKKTLMRWFEKYPNQFVAVYANGNEIGSYCTKDYKDLDRLYDDMLRYNVKSEDICFKSIKDDTQESLDTLLTNIESLGNELSDIKSAYQSALVKKQAIEANLNRFAEKQEAIKLFVDNFNAGKTSETMELVKTYSTKFVLIYKHNDHYSLKKGISLYDELNPILKNIVEGIKLYRKLPKKLQETAFIEDEHIIIHNGDYNFDDDYMYITIDFYKDNNYKFTYKFKDNQAVEMISSENLSEKLKSLSEG